MADQIITLNQNVAECLRSTADFGGSIVRNICNGAETYVPWGSAEWAGCIALCLFGAAILAMLAGVSATIIRDSFMRY